jgi:hypothetical protein
MTIHQFSPQFKINIADIKLALGNQNLGLFYDLTDSDILRIEEFIAHRDLQKNELTSSIKQLKKQLSVSNLKADKKIIKNKIKKLEIKLDQLIGPKKKKGIPSKANPLNPSGYKYSYVNIITTSMGNKR